MKIDKCGACPETEQELLDHLHSIEEQPHDYNSIAEALTDVTLAMFNYFANKHGMSGFQASWSGMKFIQKIRGMEAPFMILDSDKMLYPQYDIHKDVEKFIEEAKPQLGKIAKEKLENNTSSHVSPNVIERWKELAKFAE
jgi:hypothetical protein